MNSFAASMSRTEPVAVVELFTSEGCSSCPPAERLLDELAREKAAPGRRIITLEFHVDYWDRLGWKDPYSSAAYSTRQQSYATALGLSGLYTPQMIVGGSEEFVGSDRGRARRALDAAWAHAPSVGVLATLRPAPGGIQLRYQLEGAPKDAEVSVALVESGLTSHVRAGENDGRTLEHTTVVRQFITRPAAGGSGSVDLKLDPPNAKTPRAAVVLVQDPRTMAILGATEVAF
jgi:hypothetical protein